VDALGDTDGTALASRTPRHKTSITTNPTVNSHSHGGGNHAHAIDFNGFVARWYTAGSAQQSASIDGGGDEHVDPASIQASGNIIAPEAPGVSGGTYGPQTNTPTDTGAYITFGVSIAKL
jgi:hypothetical protein